MDAAGLIPLATPTFLNLANYLRDTVSQLTPTEAATLAIDQWLAANADARRPAAPEGVRGYQWKCLFLPDATELRMCHAGETHFARVVGDDIVYRGQRVSPRQLTLAIAGDGRNAWRELLIRLPGEKSWKRASVRRNEIMRNGAPVPVSPAETMSAAAACMSEALKTALALVEHSNAQATQKYERRVERHRRADDVMIDDWKLD